MSAYDRALKRARQQTGTLPEGMAPASAWLETSDDEDGAIPAGLLDRFAREEPLATEPSPTVESAFPAEEPLTGEALFTSEAPDPLARFDLREPPRPTARVETPAVHLREAAEARHDGPPRTEAERWESKGLFNGFNPRMAGKVVSGPQMDQATAEQYGRVAAVLHHAQNERKIKTVMVTSAMAGEGKTLTALNLALTLSESYGRRVAFIDADLRCSRVHELLNVVRVRGLSEALQDGGQVHARLLAISPRLSVLLAGCSNLDPSGALTSPRMAQVLAEAAAGFDWVIVDTPPVVLLPDTNLLARMVDGAIVVIRAGKTAYDVVERAIQTLDRKRVLGVVLNDAQDAEALQYYYSARATP
jgi:capsular exopolysaccharide synthesis family protein